MLPRPAAPPDPTPDPAAPGDARFAALYRAHFDFVYRTLRRLGVPPALVDDAAQEVFLVVLRRRPAGVASIRGWLFGITRRIAWRARRSSARQRRLAQALEHARPAPADGPTAVAEREAAALLGRFLDGLGDDKRAVFLLAELEQMTAPEISRALGVKENTVYSRLRAARQDFDRAFARLRLRERRAVGDDAIDDRALLLSRARRAHEPTPADRRRVWLGLCAPLGLPPDAPVGDALPLARPELAAAPAVGAPLASHLAWAAAIALVGALAVAAGRAGAGGRGPEGHVDRDMSERTYDEAAARGPAPAGADAPAPGAGPRLMNDVSSDRSEGAGLRGADAAADPPGAAAPAPARARLGAGGPAPVRADPDAAVGDDPHAAAARTPAAVDPPAPALGPTAGDPSPAASVDPDALRREADLIARARAELLAGRGSDARALLERHAREFPAGALVNERELSLITALCALGERAAARVEIDRAVARRPGSAHARRAAALCPPAPSTDNSPTDGERAGD